jgi:sugar lactone lactonase YvrE
MMPARRVSMVAAPCGKAFTALVKKLLALVLLTCPALAATIELVAGGGTKDSDAPAKECRLREPFGVEFAPDGAMLIIEMVSGNRLLRVDSTGRLTRVAGTIAKGFAGDGGPALNAQFNGPHNLAIAPTGDVYLSDSWNYRVRKIDAKTQAVTTIAGTGKKAYSGEGGPATAAEFSTIIQIALSPDAKHLYLADIENRRIRRIALETGIVETVAGNGQKGVPKDGETAQTQPLTDPRGVVPTADGSFYILERGGHALRHVDATGKIRSVAGTGKAGLSGDGGPALSATLNGPKHLCLDRDGTVLIADAENHVIRRYDPKNGTISRVAGTGRKGTVGLGGDPLQCELNRPHGVTIGPNGFLYITDSYNDRILRIVPVK